MLPRPGSTTESEAARATSMRVIPDYANLTALNRVTGFIRLQYSVCAALLQQGRY